MIDKLLRKSLKPWTRGFGDIAAVLTDGVPVILYLFNLLFYLWTRGFGDIATVLTDGVPVILYLIVINFY